MLDFSDFAPQMELYFGHFVPRLRSLALNAPRHNLLSFIGLFPNLDNLRVTHSEADNGKPGYSPVPQSAPSMRGCLTLRSFGGERFLRDLSKVCRGLQFHSMDLVGDKGAHLLLDACAGTLETLQVHPGYWTGMGCS